LKTGKPVPQNGRPTYTAVFEKTMVSLGRQNSKIAAITAAMTDGTGLTSFAREFPKRFFDVGIAEGHAVTFAGGLCRGGFKPVVALYSTFLQRAYDHIMHDVALQNLPVVFAVDRAGIVGEDGATHNGCFDIAFLRTIPNMVIMAPKDENEYQHKLYTAVNYQGGPSAVRYPKGRGYGVKMDEDFVGLEIGKAEVVYKFKVQGFPASRDPDTLYKHGIGTKFKVVVIALGTMVNTAVEAAKKTEAEGIDITVINARFAKPLDNELIITEARGANLVVTVEEGTLCGGFGSAVVALLEENKINVPVKRLGVPDQFMPHGSREEILALCGLGVEGVRTTTGAISSGS
jgi:1-deoxy-D-xylulose-5-phosphate synthase